MSWVVPSTSSERGGCSTHAAASAWYLQVETHDGNPSSIDSVSRSLSNNNCGRKFPKKMHKAEREKLKRDHLNELFLELDHSLESSRQNNGKACILGDATRLLPDLIAQVESLRKENATLVSESHYVTLEKNELKDEKRVLEADIEKLQSKLQQRLQSDLVLHNLPHSASTALPIQQQSAGTRPALMAPPHQELQLKHELEATRKPKSHSHVKRPQARYPTPFDSWPLELLTRHPQSANGTTNNAVDNSSNRA